MYPHEIRLRGPWQYRVLSTSGESTGTLTVPGYLRHQGLGDVTGTVELTRSFNWVARLEAEDEVWLVLDKVAGRATVRLNGTTLGQHDVYWDRFRFPVTELLQPRNELVVTLDAAGLSDESVAILLPPRKDAAEASTSAVCGILGGVHLSVESRRFFLQKLSVETSWQDTSGMIRCTADWDSSTREPFTAILRLDDREILRQVVQGTCRLETEGLSVEPWWPRQLGFPKLYPLTLEFLYDRQVFFTASWQVGFRTYRWEGRSLWCNDRLASRDIESESFSLHADVAFQEYFGEDRTRPFGQWTLAQQASIRVRGYLAPDSFYRLCDRGGLIVDQDLSFTQTHPSPSGDRCVLDQLSPHPSVVCRQSGPSTK